VAKSIPTYALILYFSYALFKVGSDLARLKDYPQEAESLNKEVILAKNFYKEKGLKL
jgi:dolichyl-phosphate mannosyltransferase polypeptide 3